MEIKEVNKQMVSHLEDEKLHDSSIPIATSSSVRPGNYLLKIESFSLLLDALAKSSSDKYDSNHFEAGGYQWKLSLYPNGDPKRDVNGYISLYLVMAEPDSMHLGWEINVMFKFFVFDHTRDTYLILQDGKDRRFHALKTEWGFAKLLPLDVFNNPSNGYLIDNSCAFGVEIFFHKTEWQAGSVSMIQEPANSACILKLQKFSTLTQESYYSDVFTVGGLKWMLQLYPKGDYRVKDKNLSLYLNIYDVSSLPSGWNVYAEFTMSIKDQLSGKHCEATMNKWFSSTTTTGWGRSSFILLDDLNDASRGFIVNDTVIVEGNIKVISVVKSHHIMKTKFSTVTSV